MLCLCTCSYIFWSSYVLYLFPGMSTRYVLKGPEWTLCLILITTICETLIETGKMCTSCNSHPIWWTWTSVCIFFTTSIHTYLRQIDHNKISIFCAIFIFCIMEIFQKPIICDVLTSVFFSGYQTLEKVQKNSNTGNNCNISLLELFIIKVTGLH